MILLINTVQKECLVGIADQKFKDEIEWSWKNDTGDEVLRNIEKLLKKYKLSLIDVKVILVNQGPGSFTGTRVGITVANTLAWSLNIPVVGYEEANQEEILEKNLKSHDKHFSKIVLPYYQK